jgi:hypothetical protein
VRAGIFYYFQAFGSIEYGLAERSHIYVRKFGGYDIPRPVEFRTVHEQAVISGITAWRQEFTVFLQFFLTFTLNIFRGYQHFNRNGRKI